MKLKKSEGLKAQTNTQDDKSVFGHIKLSIILRCGNCLLFRTPKCTWLYSYEVKTEIKEVNSWKEFVEWLYTIDNKRPILRKKRVRNIILRTDIACASFIREK